MSLSYYAIDYDFLSNMEIPLVAGRGFSEAFATDEAQAIMLNETAVRAYGLGTPTEAVGQFVGDAQNQPYQVIGVVEDFYHKSVFDAIRPVMLRYVPRHFSFANLRVRSDETEDIVAYLNEVWAGLGTTFPLSYTFYDVQITEDLSFMRELGGLVGLMALLSIVIACLGLLGMVSYSTETRIKEIGIRKVLGADVGKVVLLLSKDFVVMLLIAIAIGAPLGWLLNNLWLQEFSIRVEMGPGIFAGGIALMLTLALGIICSQTVKIAQTNPADTLRPQ